MLCDLIFKKSFGIRTLPLDFSTWLMELGSNTFDFNINNKPVSIEIGEFGKTEREKIILSGFYSPDERCFEYICEISTIDIKMSVELQINEQVENSSELNVLVEPFINDAFSALKNLVDASRIAKYNIKRKSEEWENGQLCLIPEITKSEFNTYLFFQLHAGGKIHYGCFSKGQMRMTSSIDNGLITKEIDVLINKEIQLSSKLIVLSWEYFFKEDYRNSLIYTATVLELLIIKTIRKYYVAKDVATISQIDKYLGDVSNRLLCTVTLGSLGVGDKGLRDRIASIFEIRNGLVHGKKKLASRMLAAQAIKDSEFLIDELENFIRKSLTYCNNG